MPTQPASSGSCLPHSFSSISLQLSAQITFGPLQQPPFHSFSYNETPEINCLLLCEYFATNPFMHLALTVCPNHVLGSPVTILGLLKPLISLQLSVRMSLGSIRLLPDASRGPQDPMLKPLISLQLSPKMSSGVHVSLPKSFQ